MQIERYDFVDAERRRYGRYPVLDTILYRWTRRIEETLFEQAGVEVYAGASVFEEMRFAGFFAALQRPRPIYFVGLEPLPGTGLFVVDNRFSAFCLRKQRAESGIKLTPENQRRLQRVVQALLADFDHCWASVLPVRSRLRKVTTYPFRARILNPYDSCLVAQIHLAGHNISARITWCLPRQMLESVLPALRGGRVLPPVQHEAQPVERPSRETVLNWLRYDLQLRMGRISVGTAAQQLAVGNVVPLIVEPDQSAVVALEGRPVLKATPGSVQGRYAFRVDAAYDPEQRNPFADPAQFEPLQLPSAAVK